LPNNQANIKGENQLLWLKRLDKDTTACSVSMECQAVDGNIAGLGWRRHCISSGSDVGIGVKDAGGW
jgi:hypothetical protein